MLEPAVGERVRFFLPITPPGGDIRFSRGIMHYRSCRPNIGFSFGGGLTPAVKKLLIANIAAFVFTMLSGAGGFSQMIREILRAEDTAGPAQK